MESTKLSKLAETLIGSEIVKLGGEIKEKIKAGNKISNFTIGDFDSSIFPIPEELKEEIIEAYKNGFTTYPPANGILPLRQAVSSFIDERLGLKYNSDEVLIAAGGRPLIYTLYRAIVDKGDDVIYAVPSWNNNHYTHFIGGNHKVIETSAATDFMPTADQIKPHITNAVLIALCSPLNPTGTVFQKKELEDICDMVLKENNRRGEGEKKLYVMFDQMYWTLTYGDTRHYDPVSLRPQMRDYTIFIGGISKMFAATGVRVGWSFGPRKVLIKMQAINSHVGAWSPMAEQHATARFLRQKDAVNEYLSYFKSELEDRLRQIYNGLIALKEKGYAVDAIAPQAAIYLTIKLSLKGLKRSDHSSLETQDDVTSYILDEAGLAVVPFYAFGASRDSEWYRLSVGTCKKEEIPQMLARLDEALGKLK